MNFPFVGWFSTGGKSGLMISAECTVQCSLSSKPEGGLIFLLRAYLV